MNQKEKRLLIIMLLLFVGYMIPFKIFPIVQNSYQSYQDGWQRTEKDIERYQKLSQASQVWEQEHQQATVTLSEINSGLLNGSSRDLVAAQLQTRLRGLATQHNVNIRSVAVPEFNQNTEWMLVTQAFQLQAEGVHLMQFLQALQAAPEKLVVVKLEVRNSSRNKQLTIDLTLTGFSRLEDMLVAEQES